MAIKKIDNGVYIEEEMKAIYFVDELKKELESLTDLPYLDYPKNSTPELRMAIDKYNEEISIVNNQNETRRMEIKNILEKLKGI